MKSIKKIISDFIERLENTPVSFWEIIFLLCGIFFIRTFLENFANTGNFYHMSGVVDTFFHYPLFFSIIVLASIVIAGILGKTEIAKAAKFIVLCSGGLLLPPILDLIIHRGGQVPYVFISGSYAELAHSFLTFLGGGAIGPGLRIEAFFALAGLGIYILVKTKSVMRSVLGVFFLYLTVFIFLSTPAVMFILDNAVTHHYEIITSGTTGHFFFNSEPSRALTNHRTFITESGNFPEPAIRFIQNQYSITLSIFFLLMHALLFFWCFFLYSREKFTAVIKNFRYLRILHNSVLIMLGIYLSMGFSGIIPIATLFDFLSFVSLFAAFFFAWLFVVWENDESDIAIDRVTNTERPLVQNRTVITSEEWKTLKHIFLAYSLGFAFLCGLYTLVFILLFIFIYHIYQVYSLTPTRLKKYPLVSSLAIAANSLLLVWMGFFMGAGTEDLNLFPRSLALGILLIFSLVENAKNLKDIEGDRREGIKTLPVLFGEKRGKTITGVFLFLGSMLVPFVFYLNVYTLICAFVFGLVFFSLAIKKNYREKYLFFAYFLYVFVFLVLLLL